MTIWIILITLGETDAHIPRWTRVVGPFRSRSVADRTAAIIRRRAQRDLADRLDEYAAAVEVDVVACDNRAARYHYGDLRAIATTEYLRYASEGDGPLIPWTEQALPLFGDDDDR